MTRMDLVFRPRMDFFGKWSQQTNLSTKLDTLIVLILVPALLFSIYMVMTTARLQRDTTTTAQYRQVIFDSANLKSSLLNIETGLRGYALTANMQFLEPYERGLIDSEMMLSALERGSIFPTQIKELRQETESYKVWVQSQLQLENISSQETRRAIWEDGRVRFDRLRLALASLTTRAEMGFASARAKALGQIASMTWLPWGLFSFLLFGAFILRWGLRFFVIRPLKNIESNAQTRLQGDSTARVSMSSNDEIGRLGKSLNASYDALDQRNQDLSRSNSDLENFAYVASHDLQEPLRMISSYTQLLAKRYQGQLDQRADQYIHFAVDGANRMQVLIQDLLAFSRVGTRNTQLLEVNSTEVVQSALRTLAATIDSAEIVVGDLPIILADRGQLEQVFVNLIGNALKFRRPEIQHRVEIKAEQHQDEWHFMISDNGIGIEAAYFDRIFAIFQRLHTREAYAGSGIGLSIVKRILERHNGRIWLESQPNIGTTFYFALPVSQVNHA